MNTIQKEILNPKAVKLLKDFVNLELISINQPLETGFSKLLAKLRSIAKSVPSLKEIAKEVEFVRVVRNE